MEETEGRAGQRLGDHVSDVGTRQSSQRHPDRAGMCPCLPAARWVRGGPVGAGLAGGQGLERPAELALSLGPRLPRERGLGRKQEPPEGSAAPEPPRARRTHSWCLRAHMRHGPALALVCRSNRQTLVPLLLSGPLGDHQQPEWRPQTTGPPPPRARTHGCRVLILPSNMPGCSSSAGWTELRNQRQVSSGAGSTGSRLVARPPTGGGCPHARGALSRSVSGGAGSRQLVYRVSLRRLPGLPSSPLCPAHQALSLERDSERRSRTPTRRGVRSISRHPVFFHVISMLQTCFR